MHEWRLQLTSAEVVDSFMALFVVVSSLWWRGTKKRGTAKASNS